MKGIYITYSDAELTFISDNRTMTISALHSAFCSALNRFDISATNLNALRKRKGWRTGRTGRFEKGNIPHPDAGAKSANKTSFKKGHKPKNWRPIGSDRISKDGYFEIKVKEPKKWQLKHVYLWEQENGKVPDGSCVSFIDGDKMNLEMSNFELISRNENLQINRALKSVGGGINKPVRLIGKITAKVIELSK